MFSLLRNTLRTIPQFLPRIITQTANFHALQPNLNVLTKPAILLAKLPNFTPICGFKMKGKLRRRCKDCYFVRREERLYVICKTHPRHKQMSMVPKPKNTWIITHATQGKVRAW